METIVDYFSDMPTTHRSFLIVGGLAIFLLLERAAPFFRKEYAKWKHAGLNIFFTLTTILVNLSMAFILVWCSDLVAAKNLGLLQWVAMPLWLQVILGLMLMDLIGAYTVHFVEHKVKWMWQFHLIHHTDQNVDSTSANRHHPGESVIRFVFTCLAVLIVGAPVWLIFLYQSASVVLTQFNHSNVKIPSAIDRVLKLVFCTPDMHRVHHHYRQPYSDKNYGNIFSFWDRIFGTYVEVDNSKLVYGLDTYMEEREARHMGELLLHPFRGYRDPISYSEKEKL